ncbi:MAG: type II toxin-antitoxin system VapC family toxin [Candidatus Binatia bacterium]
MIVLDASAIVDLILDLSPHADEIRDEVTREAPDLLTLHLVDAEVGQVLRRYVRRGEIAPARAVDAMDDLEALPLQRYAHLALLKRAFALRDNATIYDALYLALAEGTGATLLTRDAKLGHVPGHRAKVAVVG